MNFFKSKKAIFITPVVLWLLSQLFLARPQFFFLVITAGFLLLALVVRGSEKNKQNQNWPLFFFFPALFFLSVSLYITFLPNYYWIQIILLLSAYFSFSYLRNIYYFFHYGASERAERLDGLMLSGGFLSVFALASSLYGLPTFLSWNFWGLLPLFVILVSPLFFQSFVLGRINIRDNWPLFLSASLVLAEMTAVIYFLPLSFNILGFFTAIFYYFILLVLRLFLKNNFSGNNLRWPLSFGIILIIILLLSSRWF
ncbi:MAG: hypothetical protein WCW61_02570 [Patescibacteria group bacterium]|jgi:hypothetical protein